MHIEQLRTACLNLPGATEDCPFGPDVVVHKVGGKIFALYAINADELRVNLKCEPEEAIELREKYADQVIPGYHMNKVHWNSVYCERGLEDSEILRQLRNSYDLIVQSLPKRLQKEIAEL